MPVLRPVIIASALVLLLSCTANRREMPADPGSAAATGASPVAALSAPPLAQIHPQRLDSAHGSRIDPYYWLRDDSRSKPEVLNYLHAENAWTAQYFKRLEPLKQTLFNEMKARIQEDDASVPTFEDGYWYSRRFAAGKQYPLLVRRKGEPGTPPTAPEEILVDGNERAVGSEFYQLGNAQVSEDGRWLAVAEDFSGRRQYRIEIRDLHSGRWLQQPISNADPALVWANDNSTLYYVEKNPVTLLAFRVRKHLRGQPTDSDAIVYTEADNTYSTTISKTKSDRYLLIDSSSTLSTEVRFLDADHPEQTFQVFLPRARDHEYSIEHLQGDFLIRSNWQAPNFRILRAPVQAGSAKQNWREVVAQRPDALIADFEPFADRIAINERSGGLLKLRLKPLDGAPDVLIAADEPAYTMQLLATPELDSGRLRYGYTSLTTPLTTYELDFASGERRQLKREPVLGGFNPADYSSEFVFVPARDGAKVPVSIVYRKGLVARDGKAPLLQYAYGSYGSSTNPAFTASRLSLLDRGFVFAIAHVRGGQEMGRHWYEDGKLLNKKNTFNDFVDVSDWLIRNSYVARDQLYAQGGSAGGLLMGAVINQAPDRYRGVIATVPFVDVVTTMLDESSPLATGEFDEWGNPAQKASYDYMLSYSPYENVRAQNYPALYVSSGLHDSQVQYFEPAKWVARLRATKTDTHPLLFNINMGAGHGGRSGRFNQLEERAQEYAFLLDLAGKGK